MKSRIQLTHQVPKNFNNFQTIYLGGGIDFGKIIRLKSSIRQIKLAAIILNMMDATFTSKKYAFCCENSEFII